MGHIQQKYDIFSNSLESYYWIGFLIADGHFEDDSAIYLELASEDVEHLKKFKKFAKTDNEIMVRDRDNAYTSGRFVRLAIRDKDNIGKICKKFNIASDKTHHPPTLRVSGMSDEQFLALLIGFIDGDGWISKNGKEEPMIGIEVHSSWLNNLRIIENFLEHITQVKFKEQLSHISKDDHAVMRITHFKVLKYIKTFAIKNKLPLLTRKWENLQIEKSEDSDFKKQLARMRFLAGI